MAMFLMLALLIPSHLQNLGAFSWLELGGNISWVDGVCERGKEWDCASHSKASRRIHNPLMKVPDGKPSIGHGPALPNLLFATGHERNGLCMALGTAEMVADMIEGNSIKESKLKAAKMHVFVRRGCPNYKTGLEKMRRLGEEIVIPLEVYGSEATMTDIFKQAIECITAAA